jgi:hypothetical protein
MKDKRCSSVYEAVTEEMIEQFIDAVKMLEGKVSKARLHAIINSNSYDSNFLNIIGQYNSVINVKTSADPND